MCGLVGLLSYGKVSNTEEKTRQEVMRFLTTELLIQTEERGKDATGISTLFEDGDFMCQKMGVPASEFVFRHGGKETDYNGYMKLWEDYSKPAKIVIAHCRKSSVGSSINNGNNHPVRVGNICVVHNGTLTNHQKIFENLGIKRDNDVDTEAIARLLSYYTEGGKNPWTIDVLKKASEKLEGSFAVLAFNANNPYQLAVMRDTRPIDVCWIAPLKMAILVSDDKFVKTTFMKYRLQREIYGKKHWPAVSSDDVTMRALSNLHVSVFNLLDVPENVTSIDDIADDTSVPYCYNKDWSSRVKHTSNLYGNKYKSESNVVGFKAKPDLSRVGAADAPKVVGKVWNKDLYKYTDINERDIKKGIEDGSTIINLNDTSTQDSKLLTSIGLKQAEFDNSEPIDNVKIIDLENGSLYNKPRSTITPENKADPAKTFYDCKNETSKDAIPGDTISVDMTVDVKAMETANEAARNVPRFSTEEELCDKLSIKDPKILTKIPISSVANMVQNDSWKRGFMEGWKVKDNGNNNTVIKRDSADTNNIRTLKAFVGIASSVIKEYSIFINDRASNRIISKAVHNSIKDKPEDLSMDRINNVFSKGDKKDDKLIRNITDKIETVQSIT